MEGYLCMNISLHGVKEMPDRSIHKLSDAYITNDDDVDLELKVLVLNINKGHNIALMEHCKTLKEYAYYVQAVREAPEHMTIEEKVEWAIDQCIKNDVLAEFLRTHRGEVMSVSIFEYDAEKHLIMEKEESRAEGQAVGIINVLKAMEQPKEEIIRQLMTQMELTEKEAKEYLMKETAEVS